MFYEGCTIDEIRAYRELESETFDFGEGKMKMEGWYGSEDAYYEMCLPEECKNYKEYHHKRSIKKHKYPLNRYAKKQITKNRLQYLKQYGSWWTVSNAKGYLRRCYVDENHITKKLKRHSNKKVRKYKYGLKNGNYYRKVFDYWWELF